MKATKEQVELLHEYQNHSLVGTNFEPEDLTQEGAKIMIDSIEKKVVKSPPKEVFNPYHFSKAVDVVMRDYTTKVKDDYIVGAIKDVYKLIGKAEKTIRGV